jgi:hypothetical protein
MIDYLLQPTCEPAPRLSGVSSGWYVGISTLFDSGQCFSFTCDLPGFFWGHLLEALGLRGGFLSWQLMSLTSLS